MIHNVWSWKSSYKWSLTICNYNLSWFQWKELDITIMLLFSLWGGRFIKMKSKRFLLHLLSQPIFEVLSNSISYFHNVHHFCWRHLIIFCDFRIREYFRVKELSETYGGKSFYQPCSPRATFQFSTFVFKRWERIPHQQFLKTRILFCLQQTATDFSLI